MTSGTTNTERKIPHTGEEKGISRLVAINYWLLALFKEQHRELTCLRVEVFFQKIRKKRTKGHKTDIRCWDNERYEIITL